MIDGTNTDFRAQIGAALFGYLIGVCAAAASFASGRHWHEWFRRRHATAKRKEATDEDNQDDEEAGSMPTTSNDLGPKDSHCGLLGPLFSLNVAPIVLLLILLALFIMGDVTTGLRFYRKTWMSMVLTPFGALLRWRLARLNDCVVWKRFHWVPWGTLLVNVVAAGISILAESIEVRFKVQDQTGMALLQAVEVGFAGSLSTVSTMIREMYLMETPMHSYAYALVTIVSSLLVGVVIYTPMVQL